MKKHNLALHIFHRDLRLHDNTALLYALKNAHTVIACFVFDERQVEKNPYKSQNALQFMMESLEDLSAQLEKKNSKIHIFYGTAEKVIEKLLYDLPISLVVCNRDYTPFALTRDAAIEGVCKSRGVEYGCFADCLLTEPEMVHKDDGLPYVIYTPFSRCARMITVNAPRDNTYKNYYSEYIDHEEDVSIFDRILSRDERSSLCYGGRTQGKKILQSIVQLTAYKTLRDMPADNHTSHLSPHNKFGTISIREVYEKIVDTFGTDHALIGELYWRDFFTHIGFHFPHVFIGAFHKKYNVIQWKNNMKDFSAWQRGMTGYPIVDAGMRELAATGIMHNRVRMITASFLVKDLLIDWRLGEKYFAQLLRDYDPAVNNGNWQWAASTGCDAQPYFRIFNPWRQQQRFDPACLYIKKWIPELQSFSAEEIHALEKNDRPETLRYPRQIVDHQCATAHTKEIYKACISHV